MVKGKNNNTSAIFTRTQIKERNGSSGNTGVS